MEAEYIEPNREFESASTQQALSQSNLAQAQAQAMNYQIEEQEKGLAEAQLECEKTLNKCYHLLKQDVLKPNKEGLLEWQPISDPKKRVLTSTGVDKLMQTLSMYINKETLLSNFNEEQINTRMLKFCKALNSNIYMKYELYFRLPTMDECKKILIERRNERKKIREIANELSGKPLVEEEFDEIRVENEIQKIKSEQIKKNLREIELLFTQLEALVEATHNRAFRGEERGSLRRHLNISEVVGSQQQQQKKGGIFSWGRG